MYQNPPLTKWFLKNLPIKFEHIKKIYQSSGCSSVNLYFQDESRFGLMTVLRRMITARGVKPVAPYLHRSNTFQLFIDHMATQNTSEFKIVILDNGAFHHAKSLVIPQNISLIFLPPYSPELNPAEKMWRYFKDRVSMVAYKSIETLQCKISHMVTQLSSQTTMSICGNEFYKKLFTRCFNV